MLYHATCMKVKLYKLLYEKLVSKIVVQVVWRVICNVRDYCFTEDNTDKTQTLIFYDIFISFFITYNNCFSPLLRLLYHNISI